jgi:hypothetical protein
MLPVPGIIRLALHPVWAAFSVAVALLTIRCVADLSFGVPAIQGFGATLSASASFFLFRHLEAEKERGRQMDAQRNKTAAFVLPVVQLGKMTKQESKTTKERCKTANQPGKIIQKHGKMTKER